MEKFASKLELIKNQLDIFQRRKNICVENCAGARLAENLINILGNVDAEEGETEAGSFKSSFQMSGERCPVQKAMSNSVVVRIILSWMSTRGLLECRKVSRLWKEEATSILVPRARPEFDPTQDLSNEPPFHVKFEKLGHLENFSHPAGTLPLFMSECLKQSSIFPCPHFIFIGGRMKDPNLIQFFSDHGQHVQLLKLTPEVVDLVTFRHVLLKWTPNLKSLTFQPQSWAQGSYNLLDNEENELLSSGPEKDSSEALSLPKLTSLTLPRTKASSGTGDEDFDFPPGADLIFEILTCAPNLTSIIDPHLTYVPQIVAADKLSFLTILTWSFRDNGGLVQNLHRFVRAGPQLKHFMLTDIDGIEDPTVPQTVTSLLQQSQGTLEKLTRIQIFSKRRLFNKTVALVQEFSQLPKVTQLRVKAAKGHTFRILPNQLLSNVFPNLKSLHVKPQMSGAFDCPPSPFCAHGLLEQLKFEDHGKFEYDWVQPMRNLYPNITKLHIFFSDKGLPQFQDGLAEIPRFFQQLEQFHIEINVENGLPPHFKSTMDQALTGLPWNIFERLWVRRESGSKPDPDPEFQQIEVLEQIRITRSILDLKKLTKLTFEVRFNTCAKPLWSHVAQFYAFQPMAKRQGLEVNVRGFQSADVPLVRSDLGPL